MARTLTAGQATVLGSSHYWVTMRAWVRDIDGNWRNLSHPADLSPPNYEVDPGQNWVESVEFIERQDDQVMSCVIELRRDEAGGVSLAPLVETSSANVDSGSSYGALVDAGREWRVDVATTAFGTAPTESDFVVLFEGEVDINDSAGETELVECRGKGAHLVDRSVEVPTDYGTEAGRPLENVIQDILDDWTDGVTLYTPNGTGGTPLNAGDLSGKQVTAYPVVRVQVMEAIQTLAGWIGYDLRYQWHNNTGDFQLVIQEPERTSPSVDWTFGASQYFDVTTLKVDRFKRP